MEIVIKAIAGVLIAVILGISLGKQGKDLAMLLTVLVCSMIVTSAITYLQPVVDFIDRLQAIGQLDSEMIQVLLKALGIGLLSEISCLICSDAGNASLGKAIQILTACVILWMSIPLLNKLLELIDTILGAI